MVSGHSACGKGKGSSQSDLEQVSSASEGREKEALSGELSMDAGDTVPRKVWL